MVSNVVQTRIIAKDETGGVFNNLDRRLRNSALSANLMASAMTGAFGAALSGATALVKGFTSAMSTAAQIQSSTLSTTGDLMNLTGLTFEQTSELVQDFRNEMAKTAADLPGQTQDYADLGASIMDNLVPAFQELGGGFDTAGFRESLDEITKFATLRAAANDIDASLAGLGISKFLGGSSISELSQLKFFEANPAVLAAIEKEAAALGQDLDELTTKQRADILQKALQVPDEVIDGMRNSTEGLIAGFRSALFDSESGFFGMLRDLDLETEGVQSIERAFNLFLRQVRDLATSFSQLGIAFPDVMTGLFNTINWFTNRLAVLNASIENGGNLLPSIDMEKAVEGFGQGFKSAIDKTISFFRNADFEGLGKKLGDVIFKVVQDFLDIIISIDWGDVAMFIYEVFLGAVGILRGLVISTMNNLIPLMGKLTLALQDIVLDLIAGVDDFIVRTLQEVSDALTFGLESFNPGEVFSQMTKDMKEMVTNAFKFWGNPFRMESAETRAPSTTAGRRPGRVANSFLGNIPSGFFDAVRRETLGKPSGSDLTIANTSELILNAVQQDSLISAIGSLVTGASGGGIQIGSINVSSNASNPEEVANLVIRKIEGMISQQRSNLARA